MKDIETRDDVAELVRIFYGDVAQDDLLGPLFEDVAKVDWPSHLPKLTMFWCRALLGIDGYHGNPYQKHADVHRQSPFREAHFHRWLELFHETIDLRWSGENSERAKELARNVAKVHSTQLTGETIDISSYPSRPAKRQNPVV